MSEEELKEPTYSVSFWFRKILVPFDGSGLSKKALALAKDFSYRYGSEVHAIYVCDVCNDVDRVREEATKIFNKVKFIVRRFDPSDSSVVNELLKALDEGEFDAVIVGSKGNSLNTTRVIGSVALSLALEFPGTVIIIR